MTTATASPTRPPRQYVTAVGGTSLSHRLQRARLDRDRLGQQLRRRGHRLRLLGRRRQAVLADRHRLRQADRQRRLRGRRPEHRRGRLRHLQRGRLARGRRHQRVLADHRVGVRAGRHPGRGHLPRRPTSTSTPRSLFDVTSGSDGSCSPAYLCTAEAGYDGPTGLGTPDGTAAFTSGTTTGNTVTVTNPGNQTTHRGHRGQPADPGHRLGLRPDADLQRHRPARRPVDQLLAPA